MKVNSISSINNFKYNNNNISFKHTAVPYPEYESAYVSYGKQSNFFSDMFSKLSQMFTPEVKNEAKNIKSEIDSVYSADNQEPKKALLSVLA